MTLVPTGNAVNGVNAINAHIQGAPGTSPTVLILGARGRLGLAATRAFSQAGWRVLAQVRPDADRQTLPAIAGVRWLPEAVHDTAALAAQARSAQVVVHALNPAYTHKAWRDQALPLMDSAIAVTRQLRATLMLPGNVYNFGQEMPPVLHADSPQAATGFMGRMRVQLEQRLRAATQGSDMRAVVLRAGDFFGSGTGGWLDQAIAKALPRGRVTWPGPLDVATPWAYLPDLARTFVRLAQERERLAPFECVQFAGHHASGQRWLHTFTAIAAEQGWLPASGSLRVGRMPWFLLRVMGLVAPTLGALAAMRYLWRTPHRLDNTRLEAIIGEEPHTPFDGAVRQALADLGLVKARTPRVALA